MPSTALAEAVVEATCVEAVEEALVDDPGKKH